MTRNLIYFTYFLCAVPFAMCRDLTRLLQIRETPRIDNRLIWRPSQSEDLKYKTKPVFLSSIFSGRALDRPKHGKGIGYNCGQLKHNFSLTWEPSPVSQNATVTFSTLAPEFFNGGTFIITSFLNKVEEYFKELDVCTLAPCLGWTCPVQKGQKVSFSLRLQNDGSWRPGYHLVDTRVLTHKASTLFMCADAIVHVIR